MSEFVFGWIPGVSNGTFRVSNDGELSSAVTITANNAINQLYSAVRVRLRTKVVESMFCLDFDVLSSRFMF